MPSSPIADWSQDAKPVSLRKRLRRVIWDTLDHSPEERRLMFKIDFFILTWASFSYFSKNLNQNNLSNAYVSGMKEELNVVGNQYQTFTTMWTIGYVISQIPSQMICTRIRLSLWCPSWECLWVIVTFASAAVKTPYQLYACRFLVGLAEGTFYPAVHTVLGSWYTKRELAKRAGIFFGSAFVGSMFSGYLQAALYNGMNGVHGLSGWRWLFIFDGVITFPMALWGYLALPDLPSNTRVPWLKPEEKELALQRMQKAGKSLEEPITWSGTKRVLSKWHFWVYTAYYTFFICSENIGGYMNLWLKSLNRYSVSQINTYPTVTNAITIVTSLAYGWTSDLLQIRYPIVFFSLTVCFFAAMNLAIWDGVPFGLKWASYYLTGYAMSCFSVFKPCIRYAVGMEDWRDDVYMTLTRDNGQRDLRKRQPRAQDHPRLNKLHRVRSFPSFLFHSSLRLPHPLIFPFISHVFRYAFNAWIPLISYNTTYAPRFLVGNSVTVGLIVCAAMTLGLAVYLQQRDEERRQQQQEPEQLNAGLV
ncbi:major facilitator superfamily domain-containing protein [Aspergillus heterothallicus]